VRLALATVLWDAGASPDNWFTVALAALNVLQTIALAYLAASKVRQNHGGQ
jgi:hypothetical protein